MYIKYYSKNFKNFNILDGVAFGSVTGYIGFYSFLRNEIFYMPELFDELIRVVIS